MASPAERALVPATVVVPTIGRTLLARCLESLLRSDPAPAEVVVVDQSGGSQVRDATAGLERAGTSLRLVADDGRGIGRATNRGVRAAAHPTVLVTHDDCTVAADWVGIGLRLARGRPEAIFTGRVLAPSDSAYVPSTIDRPDTCDYTGRVTSGVLYPANMVFDRDRMLAFGGFDERPALRLAAEDNDLCYRWLVDGRPLRYEPSLVVWHHDWRSPEQLRRTNVTYARAQGAFYAKHLLARDPRIVPLLWWDLRHGISASVSGTLRRTPRWKDLYREMAGPLLAGLAGELWRSRRGRC